MLIISLEEWNVSSVVHRNLLEEIPLEDLTVEEIHTEEDVIPTEEDAIPIVVAVAAEVLREVVDDSDLVLAVVAVVRDLLLEEITDVAIVRDLLLEEMRDVKNVRDLLLEESVIRRERDRERDVIRTKKLYLYNLPCLSYYYYYYYYFASSFVSGAASFFFVRISNSLTDINSFTTSSVASARRF